MTPEAAKTVRDKWISEGSLFCLHLTTCLGQTVTGYLTGTYICLAMRQRGGEKDRLISPRGLPFPT